MMFYLLEYLTLCVITIKKYLVHFQIITNFWYIIILFFFFLTFCHFQRSHFTIKSHQIFWKWRQILLPIFVMIWTPTNIVIFTFVDIVWLKFIIWANVCTMFVFLKETCSHSILTKQFYFQGYPILNWQIKKNIKKNTKSRVLILCSEIHICFEITIHYYHLFHLSK